MRAELVVAGASVGCGGLTVRADLAASGFAVVCGALGGVAALAVVVPPGPGAWMAPLGLIPLSACFSGGVGCVLAAERWLDRRRAGARPDGAAMLALALGLIGLVGGCAGCAAMLLLVPVYD